MARKIKISSGGITVGGALSHSPTADAIWSCLPITAEANTWGDEIYFTIPVQAGLEDTALEVVEKGDIAYWPTGAAFCIFFGPTPVSRKDEIRPASAVNVFGKIHGDTSALKKIRSGSRIVVEKAG
ncbi:MAG: cyclophilin-like fold protein [Pseudomonadota bacterium]